MILLIGEVITTLVRARENIRNEDDWCKGEKPGRHCAQQAIAVGAESFNYGTFCAAVKEFGCTVWGVPFIFNDAPRTTHAQVLNAFDATIERLRRRLQPS